MEMTVAIATDTTLSNLALFQVRLGSLVQDLRSGAGTQHEIRDYYAPLLAQSLASLEGISGKGPDLSRPISVLLNFSRDRNKHIAVSHPDLRAAAQSVYEAIVATEETPYHAIASGIQTMSLEKELPIHIPRSHEIQEAYEKFSPELKSKLTSQEAQLPREIFKGKFDACELSQSALYLRATCIQLLSKILSRNATPQELEYFREILEWISGTHTIFCHDFFQLLLRNPEIKLKGGMQLIRACVDKINQARGSAIHIGMTVVKKHPEAPRGQDGRRCLYYVRSLQADHSIKTRCEKVISNPQNMDVIIRHSGRTQTEFFTPTHFAAALTDAFISLTRAVEGIAENYHALAAILDLFTVDAPILNGRDFFYTRLVNAGIPYARFLAIVAEINDHLCADYKVSFTNNILRFKGPSHKLPYNIIKNSPIVHKGIGVGRIKGLEIKGRTKMLVIENVSETTPSTSFIPMNHLESAIRPLSTPEEIQEAMGILDQSQSAVEGWNKMKVPQKNNFLRGALRDSSARNLARLLRCNIDKETNTTGISWGDKHRTAINILACEIAIIQQRPLDIVKKEIESKLRNRLS